MLRPSTPLSRVHKRGPPSRGAGVCTPRTRARSGSVESSFAPEIQGRLEHRARLSRLHRAAQRRRLAWRNAPFGAGAFGNPERGSGFPVALKIGVVGATRQSPTAKASRRLAIPQACGLAATRRARPGRGWRAGHRLQGCQTGLGLRSSRHQVSDARSPPPIHFAVLRAEVCQRSAFLDSQRFQYPPPPQLPRTKIWLASGLGV